MKTSYKNAESEPVYQTLTLRVRDKETQRIIRTAMKETGEVCATRAILSAITAFDRLSSQSRGLLEENNRLRKENAALKETVARIRELLDHPPVQRTEDSFLK